MGNLCYEKQVSRTCYIIRLQGSSSSIEDLSDDELLGFIIHDIKKPVAFQDVSQHRPHKEDANQTETPKPTTLAWNM